MLIVLEGVDGAGKSTLGDALERRISKLHPHDEVRRFHKGPPTAHAINEYLRPLAHYRPGQGRHWILDRWHLGEWVYPRLLNRSSTMDWPVFHAIELFLTKLGASGVYCRQFTDAYQSVYAQRGEDISRLSETEKLFDEVPTALPFMQYNWQSSVSATVDDIITSSTYWEKRALDSGSLVTYTGAQRYARYLLVGDRRVDYDATHPTGGSLDPAFLPLPSTSGHFLFRALANTPLRAQFGLVNANDVDELDQLPSDLLAPEHSVVALGRNASKQLTKLDIRHAVVPHPQYVRRFHYSMVELYGSLLIHALRQKDGDYGSWPN